MINFSFIGKILSLKTFNTLLWDRIKRAFDISFNRTNKEFNWESKPNPAVLDYFKQRELILSEKTMSRVTGDIKYEILEGIKNKESITDLTNRLEKVFDGERWQIERIARTETLNAFSAGEFQAQIQSGVTTYKSWLANINNKRVGEDSKRLHGQVQPINKPFIDPLTGGECMHSPNRPNCRCFYDARTLIYTVDGYKKMSDIKIGDLVLTHNGRFRKIKKIHENLSNSDKYKISLNYDKFISSWNHLYVNVTEDHPLLTKRSWIDAKDLKYDDYIKVLADICPNCGSLFPMAVNNKYNFCCIECAHSYTAKQQWDDPNIMKDVPYKISKSMIQQYKSGERSKWRSPEHLKLLIVAGTKALKSPEVRAKNWVYKPKEETKEIRDKIRKSSTGVHPSEETRKKMSESKKRYFQECPEKHPNYILAQKGHETNIEKSMRNELNNRNIKYEKQYKVDRFWVDFAIPNLKIGIECDGEYWHQDKEKEKLRDEIIESHGWQILHFTGSEINKNVKFCVDSIERLMMNHNDEYKFMWLPIHEINISQSKRTKTYNLSVEEDESFIIRGLVTHNCSILYYSEKPKTIKKHGMEYLA